jgi:glutamine synthetase
MEYRAADPVCNPYLTFAVMLAAGLEGVEKGYELPAPLEQNIYKMSETERKKLGVKSLPASLGEAIAETEKSELVRRALGEHSETTPSSGSSRLRNRNGTITGYRSRLTRSRSFCL